MNMKPAQIRLLALTLFVLLLASRSQAQSLNEIKYLSSADGSEQHAMFYAPDAQEPVPLLVVLHTWSGDYKQTFHAKCTEWCIKKGWACIHPDFRGPNNRPQATGSELVVKDIVSAVEFSKKRTDIDSSQIYLLGSSGGGYAALLMAGRHPEIWAGVSAWVPILDLKTWHSECSESNKAEVRRYALDIEKSCGGAPGVSAMVDEEFRRRSAITYLTNARGLPLDINAGIMDGHTGSVPISHSLKAFNLVAARADRISEADIQHFVDKAEVLSKLQTPIEDPSYGSKIPLFRRASGNARITIFQGGHELVAEAAISWLERRNIAHQKNIQSEFTTPGAEPMSKKNKNTPRPPR